MKIDNFLSELKRRNVYKVAVAYAVVAWLTIQAASIFLPAVTAPQWAMKILVVVIISGLPAVISLCAFEASSEYLDLLYRHR